MKHFFFKLFCSKALKHCPTQYSKPLSHIIYRPIDIFSISAVMMTKLLVSEKKSFFFLGAETGDIDKLNLGMDILEFFLF